MLPALYFKERELPQGSVLSVTLFLVTINGMVNAVGPFVATSLYVDDFAVYCSSRSTFSVERWLQIAVNRSSRWLWRVDFSCA